MRKTAFMFAALLCGCSMADTPVGGELPRNEELAAGGFTGYYDLGDYFLYGEVVNATDSPVYDVELLITCRDAGGAILGTDTAGALLGRIDPGSSAPVYNILYAAPAGISDLDVDITGYSAANLSRYTPLTILNVTSRAGLPGVVVEGVGRNDTAFPVSAVKLVASFRDPGGKVVGIYFDYPVTGTLQPGGTFGFTIETFDSTIEDASVLVQGEGIAGN